LSINGNPSHDKAQKATYKHKVFGHLSHVPPPDTLIRKDV
jgi:hypothetical protein